MRNDTLDLVMNHLFDSPSKRKELAKADQQLLERIEYGFAMWLCNPSYSEKQIRNALMNEFGVSRQQASLLLNDIEGALANVETASRKWTLKRIDRYIDDGVEAAKLGNFKLADRYFKAADQLAKAHRTDLADGEVLDAKKYVNIEKVEIVTDPTVINVNLSDKDKEETRKLMEKYHIKFDDDAIQDAEIVNDNEPGLSS